MNVSDLLNNLNQKQRAAVVSDRGHVLVLAGAGSGKTRVLIHRIAWLLSANHYSAYSIMAVTFTNRAAKEMQCRIEHLMDNNQKGMWIGTFHGLAHRLLRIHYQEAKLPQDFQIIDNEDQLRILKRLIESMDIKKKKWSPIQAREYIRIKKNKGLRPRYMDNMKNCKNSVEMIWQRIYQIYQETCDRAGLVDFEELLLRVHELWCNNPHVLNHYRKRFTNILIDEFQDTNHIQYALIQTLASNDSNIMIVGDDDQSIYSWRGANIENIHHFLNDFSNVQTIRLEQNYRSTNNILKAANALISNNTCRLGKNLWTPGVIGEPIKLYCASNETDEARFVANYIKIDYNKGKSLNEYAILYRRNAQSRIFEEVLFKEGLPYRIYGGVRFFERQEVKDVLAYLRLIVNRNDDAAYERVINRPTRGIGSCTFKKIRQNARNKQLTLWQSSFTLLNENIFTKRSNFVLRQFLELIETLALETKKLPLHIQTDEVIKKSGLWDMYEQEKGEKGRTRLENLEELITATRQFSLNYEPQDDILPLNAFLAHAVLETSERKSDFYQDEVKLMTLHSSKGLEFPKVFIVGMEEGIFPSEISLRKESLLEEERRLAYVGITRAMKKLIITYANTRKLHGKEMYHSPSRFINELPVDCLEPIFLKSSINMLGQSSITPKTKKKL